MLNIQYMYFAVWGIFAGGLVMLDKYARGEVKHPETKGQTIALYISVLLFSGIASVITGILCNEYNVSDNFTYIAVGLSGIVGRDLVMIYVNKFMKKIDPSKPSILTTLEKENKNG